MNFSNKRFYIQYLNSLSEWVCVRATEKTQNTFLWFNRFDRANARMQEEAASRPGVPHRVVVREKKAAPFKPIGAQFCVGEKVGLP